MSLLPRQPLGLRRVRAFLSIFAGLLACAALGGQAYAAGTVVLYTPSGFEDLYKDVLPAFEAKEGVKVVIVSGGSGELVDRVRTEKDSPKADVVMTTPPFIQAAAAGHLLQPIRLDVDAHMVAGNVASDGTWRTFIDDYVCFGVNPEEVSILPTTFEDLLRPDLVGKIAYSNPATAGDGMALVILAITAFGSEDAGFSYLKKLEGSVRFHTRGTGYLDVLLNDGEIAVANGDLVMDLADAAGGGLSIEPIFLSLKEGDPPLTFSLPTAMGLVAHGPNGALGQKLIEYLLTKEVQAKLAMIYAIPARDDIPPDSPNAGVVRNIIDGVRVLPVDWTNVGLKKDAWLKRFKDEVIGDSGKQVSVVPPK